MIRFLFPKILVVAMVGTWSITSAFDSSISVRADIPSGTYDHALQVHLSASSVSSEPVKISWTDNPNGSPADAHIYQGPISILSSTHLLYFAFSDPTNATSMEDRQYTIQYPQTISFDTDKISVASGSAITGELKLRNNGGAPIDLSRWKVVTDSDVYVFPWGVTVSAGKTIVAHSLRFKEPFIWIESPDGAEVARIAISLLVAKAPIIQKKPTGVATVISLPKQIDISIAGASGSVGTGSEMHSVDTGARSVAFVEPNPGQVFSNPSPGLGQDKAPSSPIITPTSSFDSSEGTGFDSKPTVSLAASVDNSSGANFTQTVFVLLLCLLLAGGMYGVSFFLRERPSACIKKQKHK